MPELPEVECVRRSLSPGLLGREVARVEVMLPKMALPDPETFRNGLEGRNITAADRIGKLLVMSLSGGAHLAVRMGMTGQLTLAPRPPEGGHVHLALGFRDGGDSLYLRDVRQFGRMIYCPDRAALLAGPMANLGPDALTIDPEVLVERLGKKAGRIKSHLLDQRILAGVGNIYADEALHRAGINPLSRPRDVSRKKLLLLAEALKETMRESLALGGSSVRDYVDGEGRRGSFQDSHRVYQKGGRPCPACGCTVERTVVGGRSTHYCPACQK